MKHFAALLILLCMMAQAFAQTPAQLPERLIPTTGTNIGSGARALGLGGTYTGIADDYSAVWWNPAGLAQVKRIEMQGSLSRAGTSDETSYYGQSRSGSTNGLRLNNLGVVFPVPVYQGALSFAFGYAQTDGFDSRSKFSSPQTGTRYWDSMDELVNGRLGLWTFAGAMDLSPNLAMGVGINYWSGTRDYSRTAFYTEQNLQKFTSKSITTDLNAWGANIGALARFGEYVRVGAMFQTPMIMDLKEDWVSDTKDGFNDYRLYYPAVFRLGASVAPGRWLIGADLEYRDWTSMEFRSETPYVDNNGDPVTKAVANQEIKDTYQATTRFSIGGEYLFPVAGLRARAGYSYEPTNYKNLGSSADQQGISLGLGLLMDRSVMFDLSFKHAFYKQETSDGSTGTVKEDIKSNTMLFTLSYRL
jgi:long-subunit fatty acid transport protein